jgi:hypothetical protein
MGKGLPLRDNAAMSMPDASSPADADPKPTPPEPPDFDACCGNGCDPCIFDLHDMAMDDYRKALKAWEARQAAQPGQV